MRAFFAPSPCSVFLLLFLRRLMTSSVRAQQETQHYTATDDRTWAIVTANLTDPYRQRAYDEFMQGCRDAAGPHQATQLCDQTEAHRLHMNQYQPRSVWNYTQTGFLKMRAPAAVFSLLHDFWIRNRDSQSTEYDKVVSLAICWFALEVVLLRDLLGLLLTIFETSITT